MKRWGFVTSGLVCFALASGATTGCSEKKETSPPVVEKSALPAAEPLAPAVPAPKASEGARREKLIRDLMMWPAAAGAPRDVMNDYRACVAEMNATPELKGSSGLGQFAFVTKCMTDLGWQVNPDANVGAAQR